MEEQTLQFRENLLNIRRILVTNRKKIKKISSKRESAENSLKQQKKIKMKEKMLERRTNINNAVGAGDSKKAKKTGLGNALGLFAIVLIATNFDKIKKSLTDFAKGDIFKGIKDFFTNTIDFFKNLFAGLSGNYGELLGDKYDELVAFKDEKMSDIEELTNYLKELQSEFLKIAEQAKILKDKFLNMLGIPTTKVEPKTDDKPYGGLYEMGDDGEYYNIFDGSPLPESLKKENNNSEISSNNLGLNDYSNLTMDDNSNIVPFDPLEPKDYSYDFAQYTDEEKKRDTVIITKINTVIT